MLNVWTVLIVPMMLFMSDTHRIVLIVFVVFFSACCIGGACGKDDIQMKNNLYRDTLRYMIGG